MARGKRVRALVRDGADPSRLEAKGVEIARGDYGQHTAAMASAGKGIVGFFTDDSTGLSTGLDRFAQRIYMRP